MTTCCLSTPPPTPTPPPSPPDPGDWPRWRPSGSWERGQPSSCPSPPRPSPPCPLPCLSSRWCSSLKTGRRRGDSNKWLELFSNDNFQQTLQVIFKLYSSERFSWNLSNWCKREKSVRVHPTVQIIGTVEAGEGWSSWWQSLSSIPACILPKWQFTFVKISVLNYFLWKARTETKKFAVLHYMDCPSLSIVNIFI